MEILGYPLSMVVTLVGIALVFVEALIPGGVFMVVGVTLLISGLLGMAVPALGTPLGLAATVAVVGVVVFLAYSRFDLYSGDGTGVRGTSDSSSLTGERGRVTETVTPDGDGTVKLQNGGMNPHYSAISRDGVIEEGATVRVVDPRGGNVLVVEPVVTPDE